MRASAGRNTCPAATPNAWPRPASSNRSGALAIRTITPWPAKLRSRTIIGLYKTEVIRPRGPWRGLEPVEFATLEWVDWFNNRRILEPIGNRPPAEAEAAYYHQSEHTALAASLTQNSLRNSRGGSSWSLTSLRWRWQRNGGVNAMAETLPLPRERERLGSGRFRPDPRRAHHAPNASKRGSAPALAISPRSVPAIVSGDAAGQAWQGNYIPRPSLHLVLAGRAGDVLRPRSAPCDLPPRARPGARSRR